MNAEIITIGDEILYGQITDTNTQYISEELTKIGVNIVRKTSIGDTEEAILQILDEASRRADIIAITGGLGPTKDDITKLTIAKFFGVGLVRHQATFDLVAQFFAKRGREMIELNAKQADVPSNCEVLMNYMGTAPGMWIEDKSKIFISMPGVPYEMKHLMQTAVIPKLKNFYKLPFIIHKMIHTVGIGESFLAEKIKFWEDELPQHIKLAYLPSLGIVKLRLTARGELSDTLEAEIDSLVSKLKAIIGDHIFAYDENNKIEMEIGRILKEKKLTLSIAESCTGGYLSHLVTSIPGSSAYFKGSIVSYANEIKEKELLVSESDLNQFGAVSEEVAKAMAIGIKNKMKTDIALATTGIAGPDGGTEAKPTGTVWIAYADRTGVRAKKFIFGNNRENNIKLFALNALNMARLTLIHE